MCLPNILSPVFMFAFIFHCRSFSLCWPVAFLIVSLRFFCFQSLALALSLLSTWKRQTYRRKKTLFCCFFLSKSPGGHEISFQIKP